MPDPAERGADREIDVRWASGPDGLTNEGNRAGVAQSVERQPSKLNVAGSRPVSRSKSHFTLGTTLSLFGATAAEAVGVCYNAQPAVSGHSPVGSRGPSQGVRRGPTDAFRRVIEEFLKLTL